MPKFSLTQMLKAVAFAAIAVAFVKSEGCSPRFHLINTIAFSRDDSRILVSKISGRRAHGDEEGKAVHVSRTVSWLEQDSGKPAEIVKQEYALEIPSSRLDDFRDTVVLNPGDDRIAAIEFGGTRSSLDIQTGKWIESSDPNLQLCFSRNGKYLAAYTFLGHSVSNALTGKQVFWLPKVATPVNWVMFSEDERKLFVSNNGSVLVWDLNKKLLVERSFKQEFSPFDILAPAGNDSVISSTSQALYRCSYKGARQLKIADGRFFHACISANKNILAAVDSQVVQLFDLSTNAKMLSVPNDKVEIMALNSDGSKLAVGSLGLVNLYDVKTGKMIWSTDPPTRFGNPTIFPVLLVTIWVFLASKRLRRQIVKLLRFQMSSSVRDY